MTDWFPWYPEVYENDTLHLTVEQDGIYRRLIDWYMVKRRPLPNSPQALAAIARIGIDQWEKNADAILPFFGIKGGLLHHKRCNMELDAQDRRGRTRSEKAAKAAEIRWGKNKDLDATSILQASPEHAPEHATRQDKTRTTSSLRSDVERALDPILDREHVEALIDHRKRKKAALTGSSAAKLAARLAEYHDPNAAVDEMQIRGWTGFKAEWMGDRATGPPRPNRPQNHSNNNGNNDERPASNAERNLASLARIRGQMGQAPGNREADEREPSGSVELLPPGLGESHQFAGRR